MEKQNKAQGVAPPPQLVWGKRCALAIYNNRGPWRGAASWRPARSAAAKKWMQRFRQRWNLTLGRLPAKDILPTATLQAKARYVGVPDSIHYDPLFGAGFGSAGRPPFRVRVIVLC